MEVDEDVTGRIKEQEPVTDDCHWFYPAAVRDN